MGLRLTSQLMPTCKYEKLKLGAIFLGHNKCICMKIKQVEAEENQCLYNAICLENGVLDYYHNDNEVTVLPVDTEFKVF